MKRLMMVAALAVAQSGCVAAQADAPVQFSSALAVSGEPGGECAPEGSKFIGQGSLDVSGLSNYMLAMRVRTSIPIGRSVTIGDTQTNVGGASITLTQFVYSYQFTPPEGVTLPEGFSLPGPEEDVAATYSVLAAGTSADSSYVLVDAFGPKAFQQLLKLNKAGLARPGLTILSTIKARGVLGSSSNVESNEFSFPVSVFSSGCGEGTATAGVCRIGQDVRTACPPPPTTPPATTSTP